MNGAYFRKMIYNRDYCLAIGAILMRAYFTVHLTKENNSYGKAY